MYLQLFRRNKLESNTYRASVTGRLAKKKNKQVWQMFLKTEELGKVYCYSSELFFSFLPSKLTNF